MNSELIVKDVEFHGDMLRAAQDPDGKVVVDSYRLCTNHGSCVDNGSHCFPLDESRFRFGSRNAVRKYGESNGFELY